MEFGSGFGFKVLHLAEITDALPIETQAAVPLRCSEVGLIFDAWFRAASQA